MRFYEFILKEDQEVIQLQQAIKNAGGDLGPTGIDGYMGPWTRQAIAKFPDLAKKYANVLAKPDAPRASTYKAPPGYSAPVKPTAPSTNGDAPPDPEVLDDKVTNLNLGGVSNNGSRTKYGGTKGIIFHHTAGGRGLKPGLANVQGVIATFKSRGVSSNFVIDRDGKIYTTVPDDLSSNHVRYLPGNKLNNGNTIGVEVIAADDSDVTPAQVSAGQRLGREMMSKYKFGPEGVAGHGQLAGQSRPPDEGGTIVAALGGQYNNRA